MTRQVVLNMHLVCECYMAKRKAKYDWGKGSSKYQKFETKVKLKWTSVDGTADPYRDSAYIDVAKCLSVLNRKLVRQGQVFKIKGFSVYQNSTDEQTMCKIGVLPRVWPMYNAYKKARGLWNEHNLNALRDTGASNLPKYYDFKILMDGTHARSELATAGSGDASDDNLEIVDFDDTAINQGDWEYSRLHTADSPAGATYSSLIHMCGGHRKSDGDPTDDQIVPSQWNNGSIGAIVAYELSRGGTRINSDASDLDQQSSTNLLGGPFGNMLSSSLQKSATVAELAESDNDDPPYGMAMIGGDREHPTCLPIWYGRVGQANNSSILKVPAFEAVAGLIRIELSGHGAAPDDDLHITFDVEIMGEI